MIVYVSSVIRACSFDSCSGYLYKIDLETGEILATFDWNETFSDFLNNERGGERGMRGLEIYNDKLYAAVDKGIIEFDLDLNVLRRKLDQRYMVGTHEICEFQGKLYITSTAFDAIVEMSFDTLEVERMWRITQNKKRHELVLAKRPGKDNKLHINSISAFNDRIVWGSSKRYGPVAFESGKDLHNMGVKSVFKHNTYEYEDCFASLLTGHEKFYYCDKETGHKKEIIIRFNDWSTVKRETHDRVARPNWLRGLERLDEKRFIIGSSPARIAILNIETELLEKVIHLSDDVKNCIHGIKLWNPKK